MYLKRIFRSKWMSYIQYSNLGEFMNHMKPNLKKTFLCLTLFPEFGFGKDYGFGSSPPALENQSLLKHSQLFHRIKAINDQVCMARQSVVMD